MSEWWTYSLADFLMFSARSYQRMFELYHREVWPAQGLGLGLGVWLALELHARNRQRLRLGLCLLAFAWLWIAIAFLQARYARINWAAAGFAWAFAAQAVVLTFIAVRPRASPMPVASGSRSALLLGLVGLYPLLGLAGERSWRQLECFALTPDLTALGTLVVLACLPRHERWLCSFVPALWCLFALAIYWTLHAGEFWLLLAAMLLIGFARRLPATIRRRPPA